MNKNNNTYWTENIRILKILMGIWFVVSFLLAIVFSGMLDSIRFAGFGLGFWMAQQGSIFIYVVLIFVYIRMIDKLDRKYGVDEESLHRRHREN